MMAYDANGDNKIPDAAVSYEDAETYRYRSPQAARVRVTFTLTRRRCPTSPSYNVIADLKGSEKPDEVIVSAGTSIRGTLDRCDR